jgi:hypothetical protein
VIRKTTMTIDVSEFEVVDMTKYKPSSLNFMVTGVPSTGKTFSLRSHPNPQDLYFIDCESGKLTLAGSKVKRVLKAIDDYELDENDKVIYADDKPIVKRHAWEKVVSFVNKAVDTGEHSWVVIDTLNELQQKLGEWIMNTQRMKPGPPTLQLQEYGLLDLHMKNLIRKLRDSSLNLIVITHAKRTEDNETGELKWYPLMVGSIRESLAGFFDFVFHAQVKKAKGDSQYRWLTAGSDKFMTKDRSGKLDRVIEPNWNQIISTIVGKEKKDG